jgi:hypothetical protein
MNKSYNKIIKNCNSKIYRSKTPTKRNLTFLVHEGVKCTRKFGNPKHTVIGTAPRTTFFD